MPLKDTITFDDFSKLDLRVATILTADIHPNADKLLKLQIDLGPELGQRQICAGIRQYVPDPAALVGKQVIIVANLAPRTIRGVESNGMMLAASPKEGEPPAVLDVIPLTLTKPAPNGSTVA